MTNMQHTVLISDRHSWTEILLNRPDRLNAITPELADALIGALRDANERKACRAILLSGAGRAFCAGQDLSLRDPRKMQGPPDLAASIETVHNPLVRALVGSRAPIVCAVHGVAAGAGIGLALACDITVAAASAKFSFGFSRIGLMPDAGVGWHLVQRAGIARARAVSLTGVSISAQEAVDWGLIWKTIADEDLMTSARQLVQRLAEGPEQALFQARRALAAAPRNSLDEQLELERRLQGELGYTADYREGVLAFLDKRTPRFGGHDENGDR